MADRIDAARTPETRLPSDRERRVYAGAADAGRFFMGQSDVHAALSRLAANFDAAGIPYAIVGAMALNAYGYQRVTTDINVLLTRDGLAEFKRRYLGRGYVEKFAGSNGLRDAESGVAIDVLLAGEFPGDGLPKPVVFPDPAKVAVRGEHLALVPLSVLVELKLASGISASHRLKDLADVLELVRAAHLPLELEAELSPFVREKYRELWKAAQVVERE